MHVVAMVALWSLVQVVVPDCWYGCHLVNRSIPVELEDGRKCLVETQACEGLCHNKAPVYVSPIGQYMQEKSCHFQEWIYETRRIPDHCYPVPGSDLTVTIPKALSCECSSCSTDNYDCSALSPSMVDCSSHEPLLLQRHF